MNPDINGQLTASRLFMRHILVAAGTQTSVGVDISTFIENCKITVAWENAPADGSTSMQFSVLDSADNTTFAASAGLPTFAAVTATSGTVSVALDTRACKRYLQFKALTASTTATMDVGAIVIGMPQVT